MLLVNAILTKELNAIETVCSKRVLAVGSRINYPLMDAQPFSRKMFPTKICVVLLGDDRIVIIYEMTLLY